jgi:hypothetical protein
VTGGDAGGISPSHQTRASAIVETTLTQRFLMARITIEDLPQSDDLDREAMRSVLGGGLSGPRPFTADQAKTKAKRGPIVDYPPGCSELVRKKPAGTA